MSRILSSLISTIYLLGLCPIAMDSAQHEHVFCSEHQTFEDQEVSLQDASLENNSEIQGLTNTAPESQEPHHRCDFFQAIQVKFASSAAPSEVQVREWIDAQSKIDFSRVFFGSEALYQLFPKTSPPA